MDRVAVIGLGYVGLPVTIACARKHAGTIGFDIDADKVAALRTGHDATGEISADVLRATSAELTSDAALLKKATFYIVAVPTPVDKDHRPDLRALLAACDIVGKALKPHDCVVFESTVYPGVTEDICRPAIERVCGFGKFKLGYSPERIAPGDKEHTLEKITKVVAGEDAETLERVAQIYSFVDAGVYRATSIKVAEAAKVLENTQRDLNIALMNELALILDRMDVRTKDVLAAASTKWNFARFTPGLVGGHCIGVDPYYLTTKAEQLGYQPQVILAGRRINNEMGSFIARKCVKLLAQSGTRLKGARAAILGLTFKENVSDLRNSRVPDIARELQDFGVEVVVHDPFASAAEAQALYGLSLQEQLGDLDAVIFAVPHQHYLNLGSSRLLAGLKPGGVVIDVKSVLEPSAFEGRFTYWSL